MAGLLAILGIHASFAAARMGCTPEGASQVKVPSPPAPSCPPGQRQTLGLS